MMAYGRMAYGGVLARSWKREDELLVPAEDGLAPTDICCVLRMTLGRSTLEARASRLAQSLAVAAGRATSARRCE